MNAFLTCKRLKSMMKLEKSLRKHPKLMKDLDLEIYHNYPLKNWFLFIWQQIYQTMLKTKQKVNQNQRSGRSRINVGHNGLDLNHIRVKFMRYELEKSHLKEKSAARLKAIINELNPKVEGVRKVTLLEEAGDCVLPWLEQLDPIMAQKLGKFQSIWRYIKTQYKMLMFIILWAIDYGTLYWTLTETQISFRGIKISTKMLWYWFATYCHRADVESRTTINSVDWFNKWRHVWYFIEGRFNEETHFSSFNSSQKLRI